MPTIPENTGNLTSSSVDILNAIRNSASENYRSYVPYANESIDSIRSIGNVLMTYPGLQNEFLSNLINRIGMVLITNKMFDNPWNVFKRGTMEFGETIEEVFVNIAKPFQFDPAVAESKVFAREIPDVRAAFHILNYQKFYKQTIQQEQLRQAFLSWNGVNDLIAKIVDGMYSSANYDEFIAMKYTIARHILDGDLYATEVPTVTSDNMKQITSTIKGVSNSFTFMSNKYNMAGVANYSNKEDQFLILNSAFDASMDVEVLAASFNMDKAEFMGHRVLVDNFGELDDARLEELFGSEPDYTPISPDEKTALNAIPGIIVDRDWFMIFDNLYYFTEQYNGEGLYWNYWYHVWKIFSVSPFANASVLVPDTPSVTSVAINPSSANVTAGQSVQLTAVVETENFAPKSVTWEINPPVEGFSVENGLVKTTAEATGSATVVATSTFDTSKSGQATVTIS